MKKMYKCVPGSFWQLSTVWGGQGTSTKCTSYITTATHSTKSWQKPRKLLYNVHASDNRNICRSINKS